MRPGLEKVGACQGVVPAKVQPAEVPAVCLFGSAHVRRRMTSPLPVSRRRRWFPPPENETGVWVVEVTARTIAGRFLLKPDSRFNRRAIGVLARAQAYSGVEVYGGKVLSSHHHLLLGVHDAEQLARFACFTQANLAKEANRIHGWADRVWARRYSAILVSDEEVAQVGRLRYLLGQGCKENLVGSPLEWPGADTTWSLFNGDKRVDGEWLDRTAMFRARQESNDVTERDFTSTETLVLSQLPCWRHLSRGQYRDRIRELVHDIERETQQRHRLEGTRPLGARRIHMSSPHDSALRPKRSPAPDFHTASREARARLRQAYRLFLAAFLAASAALRSGHRSVAFPGGSFPPRLPFEPFPRARAPA